MDNGLMILITIVGIVGPVVFAFRYANAGEDRAKTTGQKAWMIERFIPLMVILIILVGVLVKLSH